MENITEEQFHDSIEYYSNVLRSAYEAEIEDANDLDYAEKYFQRVLFLENEMVPYKSVTFNEFRFSYNHYNCLNATTSYSKTIELLPRLRTIGKNSLIEARKYSLGNQSANISEWHIKQLEDGSLIEELIQLEELVLQSTDENLIGALAVHLAGQQLYKEFKNTQPTQANPKTKHQYQFTRNEQILAVYYLIQSLGVNPYQVSDRTKLAALFHLIMGVPYESATKLKDLTIYKALSVVPQVVNDDKQFLKYLRKIRPYFLNANFDSAVEMIDRQIFSLNSDLD